MPRGDGPADSFVPPFGYLWPFALYGAGLALCRLAVALAGDPGADNTSANMFFNGRLVVLKFVKRLAIRKRGMEALQAVVMIAIALVIASVLQTKGKSAASGIGDTLMKFVGGAADVVGGLVGKGIPFVPGI